VGTSTATQKTKGLKVGNGEQDDNKEGGEMVSALLLFSK
jgi:hypothetical protein